MIAWGAMSTRHPIMAHIIPIRRCNLSCTYCNEYDDFSKPVPTETSSARINQLADLGTVIVTLSGGEPLLASRSRRHHRRHAPPGLIAGMITNGYLLMPERVKRLNQAGLDCMQISIDNVMPDDVSKKSLKVLDKKLASAWPSTPYSTSTSTRWSAAGFTIRKMPWWSAAARWN